MGQRKSARDTGLTGSLKDFGLTDLFQILGQQQKTGVLNLKDDKKAIVQVLFDRGMIVGVSFPAEKGEETPLGKRLIRGGLLSPENWKKAYEQHKEELISIERILVKNGMIRNEDLTAVVRLLTFETIYNLFKWKGGTFRFEAVEVYYDPNFVEPLNAEYLLLDVLRMVDEWPLLAKRIPAFTMILQKVAPLATLDVLTGTPWEKKRSFQMEGIYELVNGIRTVNEIIDLSFVGEFDTCKNLIDMMDAGVIEPTAIEAGAEKKKRFQVTQHLLDVGTYLAVIILGVFIVLQFTITRWDGFPFSPGERKVWLMVQDNLLKIQQEKISNAREVFFIETSRYPKNPAEMVKKGLLPR